MNSQSRVITNLITALSILGLTTITQTTSALADNQPTAPIDDGARYLRGLESKQSADWNFASEENKIQTDYQLRLYEPDVRLVEQQEQEWDNRGDQPNFSVLVDVYDFNDEAATNTE